MFSKITPYFPYVGLQKGPAQCQSEFHSPKVLPDRFGLELAMKMDDASHLRVLNRSFICSLFMMKAYLVNTGINHNFLFSPNTSIKLLCFPKLKPFLSGPL